MYELNTLASLTWISVSPLVFIAVLPTKYALKLASGMFTFCPKPIIGKARSIAVKKVSFFIVVFLLFDNPKSLLHFFTYFKEIYSFRNV